MGAILKDLRHAQTQQAVVRLVKEFEEFIRHLPYHRLYVGITNQPKRRLFEEHNVSQTEGTYICRETPSEECARLIEQFFIEQGLKGGGGGGDDESVFVYIYLKTSYTKP